MKRTLRIAGAFALCLTMIPAVTSCGDDDDDEPGKVGNTVIIEETGTRLSSVGNVRIIYDEEGRVSRFGSGSEFGEIDYRNGLLVLSDFDDEGEIRVKFNGKGYISSLSQEWDYKNDEEWSKGRGNVSFSYDGDGHLVEVSMSSSEDYKDYEYGESGKYNDETKINLKWRSGNLVQVLHNGTESEEDEKGYEKYNWSEDYALDYNMDDENKFLQMTKSQFECVLDDSGFSILACAGLFGVGSKLLPTRIVENDDDGYTETTGLRFTLNYNGSIASEIIDGVTYYYGYDDVYETRSAMGVKLFSSKKSGFFRTHRDRRDRR